MNSGYFLRLVTGKIFLAFALVAIAATALVFASGTHNLRAAETGFSEAQTTQIESIIKSYLLDHPDVVIDALEAHQKNQEEAALKQQQEMLSANKEEIFNNPLLPTAGNPQGDVTIVEFFDYNCGYCKKALPDMLTLVEEDPNIKFVFVDMPILSEKSHEAARWALAANEQGHYFDFHVALMNNRGAMSKDDYIALGEKFGLDTEKLEKDATDNDDIEDLINMNLKLSRSLNIRGTPAFVIGDQIAPGYVGVDAMRDAVAKAREE